MVCNKVKQMPILCPSLPSSSIQQTEMSDCVLSSFKNACIHSSPKLKTNHTVLSHENQVPVVYSYNGILHRNKTVPTNDTYNNIGKFQNHYVETKKIDTKGNLLYDSIYMKFSTGKIIYDDRSQNRVGVSWGGLGSGGGAWGGMGKLSPESHFLQ